MERVELIIKKLQQLINDNANTDVLLTVSQMLVAQLEELQTETNKSVSVILPRHPEVITEVPIKKSEPLPTIIAATDVPSLVSSVILEEINKEVKEEPVHFSLEAQKQEDENENEVFDYEPSIKEDYFETIIAKGEKEDSLGNFPEMNYEEISNPPIFAQKDRFSFFNEPLKVETQEILTEAEVALEEPQKEYVLEIPDELAIQMGVQPKPPMSVSPNDFIFEEFTRIPTLDLNEKSNEKLNENEVRNSNNLDEEINNKFKEHKIEVAHLLENTHIKDLKKAISINERYVFINDLFKGDEHLFERSVKHIQSFSILPEATFWIERELKIPLQWSAKNEVVQLFDQLVKRRFT